ncbi:hypothetical protein FHS23_003997 [Prauserella isguenensis]|uniref:Uncharacterized protein n=1 Tax=Prauserella isguenensis TaxID=1470180 RepID=A0A839S6G8_9PSEU|nr:hypothetical protein [Prauserella isguenensis]MBB3052954.1 hypothetical protein [Prauserella isguenensis]
MTLDAAAPPAVGGHEGEGPPAATGGTTTGEPADAIIAPTDGFAPRMMQHPRSEAELETLRSAHESAVVTLAGASRPG